MYYVLVTKKRYYKHSAIREFGFLKSSLPIINSCRLNAVFLTNPLTQNNMLLAYYGTFLSKWGYPGGVGSGYGRFEVLGGGV